jgi:5-methylcytosine-specific restriction endonuclease McrA
MTRFPVGVSHVPTSHRQAVTRKDIEMDRIPVSKKTRFDVFKRDFFTCQYCGLTPPAAVLEIDHIHPVSKGGKNGIDNLITSCFDCNRENQQVYFHQSHKLSLISLSCLPKNGTTQALERSVEQRENGKNR